MPARILAVIWLAAAGPATPAPGPWMADADLSATFTGRSIDGHYDDGDTFREVFGADGRVSYRDARRQSGGRWLVEAGTLCTLYDDDPAGGCYRVRRESENCFAFYFVARTEMEARREPRSPAWTARGWFPEKPSTCVEGQSV